jgi:Na+/H+ antiporter NhaD/arsenite permease-like protein
MAEDVASWQVVSAVAIFLVTYSFIISEKINRALIALAGALVMVIFGLVDFEATYGHHIEWKTIFLLIGMMILVGISNKTGMFQFAAVKAAQLAKGEPVRILLMLASLTALASAFLDNVTTVLLVVPVTFSITRILQVNPIPFLIAEILAANIGGTATLIGDPPNIMIGSANEHLTFNMFLLNLGPAVLIIMIVTLRLLKKIYGKQMSVSDEQKAELMGLSAKDYITDSIRMKKSLIVLGLTIVGFVLHSVIHVEAAVIALTGATVLMLIGVKEHELEEVFQSIEWTTIFFFVGLFVLVGGLIDVGVIQSLASKAVEITGGDIAFASMLILWVSGIASATIDNIPFVATMIPLIDSMGAQMGITDAHQLNPVWWSLALGACLGGNGTLIGASANVIVAGLAAREGKELSYMHFLKIGAPLTLVALIISTVYVYFVFL